MAKKSPASILKSKGLIPSWDLRKPLSRGQKSWITKQTKKFADVLRKPDEFTTIRARSKAEKAKLKSSQFPITNQRAVIHVGKGGKARWSGESVKITHSTGRKMKITYANGKTFRREIDKAAAYKLKANEVWGFTIGQHANHANFRSFDDLLRYVSNTENFHSEDYNEYLNLVLIQEPRAQLIPHNKSKW